MLVAGLLAAGIGGMILFTPIFFYSANNIDLVDKINFLNEVRASGGSLLVGGLFIAAGSFIRRITFLAAPCRTVPFTLQK